MTRRVGALLLLLGACVFDPAPSSHAVVVLDRQWAAVLEGDSTRLTATALGPQGDTLPNQVVTWTSGNPAVAEVDQTGLVRAHALGFASITAARGTPRAIAGVVVTPAVLVGAGDIASCSDDDDEATAQLLDAIPGIVFTAGDNAYPNGTADQFVQCYHPTWGRHKARTRPSPGNREYNTPGAAPYYAYFGHLAGEAALGDYSYDVAAWHIISLNSNISMAAGSAQEQWLRGDLAAHPNACTLAYWHHPRFSSGEHGSFAESEPLWQALYDANAEVVISGHDHNYERFAPQSPAGLLDTMRGIREFVVGSGGAAFFEFEALRPNSEVRDSTQGVIRVTLRPTGYDWEFVPVAGKTFSDSGSGSCH